MLNRRTNAVRWNDVFPLNIGFGKITSKRPEPQEKTPNILRLYQLLPPATFSL